MTIETAIRLLKEHKERPWLLNNWTEAMDVAIHVLESYTDRMKRPDEEWICHGGVHNYVLDQVIDNCTVEVLKCADCGEMDFAWKRNGSEQKSKSNGH